MADLHNAPPVRGVELASQTVGLKEPRLLVPVFEYKRVATVSGGPPGAMMERPHFATAKPGLAIGGHRCLTR